VRRSRRGRKMSTKRQKLLRNKENVIRFNQSFGNHCKSVAVSKTITQMMLTILRNVLSCSNERKFSWTYSPNQFFFPMNPNKVVSPLSSELKGWENPHLLASPMAFIQNKFRFCVFSISRKNGFCFQ
jgi:hypothetical protein